MNVLYDAFPEFDFFDDDGSELYHDTSLMLVVNPHIDLIS